MQKMDYREMRDMEYRMLFNIFGNEGKVKAEGEAFYLKWKS